jgi:hypothetical protein
MCVQTRKKKKRLNLYNKMLKKVKAYFLNKVIVTKKYYKKRRLKKLKRLKQKRQERYNKLLIS